jgi:hypothetical protein
MSFLLDPPLLVALGIFSALLAKTREGIRMLAVLFIVVVMSTSILLYLDVLPWPWFNGWTQGSEWMLNSGLNTNLERSKGSDILALVLFGAYPLWLWLGIEVGNRIKMEQG